MNAPAGAFSYRAEFVNDAQGQRTVTKMRNAEAGIGWLASNRDAARGFQLQVSGRGHALKLKEKTPSPRFVHHLQLCFPNPDLCFRGRTEKFPNIGCPLPL
jgi:hypothetical protein